jgi:diguanylate cyclase (GGDEF)-like protein
VPPDGKSLSMSSSVYLATLFTFGALDLSWVLLLNAIITIATIRTRNLWKHMYNFSNYSIAIALAYHIFTLSGGEVGTFQSERLLSYLAAITAYFLANLLIICMYFAFTSKDTFLTIFFRLLRDSAVAYVSTLLLSMVLSILIQTYHYFGLTLFTGICVLLSFGFRELFRLYSEVAEKAIKDQRTGLFNHGYFEELLEKELGAARSQHSTFSVAILDIDNFKRYNDTFGHLKGDRLLEFVAQLMKRECEPHGYIVARYGGEEFTVLMPKLGEMEAFRFINLMRKRLNDSEFAGADVFPHGCVSFSAGVTEYRPGILEKSQLLDKADQALHYSKAQGKNMVHIYNERSTIQQTIAIEHDVHEIEQQLNIFLAKDVYTFQHSKRVFGYAIDFCEYIQLPDAEKKTFVLGALIHDIGKLEVPKDILKKKSKLTAEEWETVKKHVEWGKDIVAAMDKYKELIPLVELHHERYDGKGYPHGLRGEDIPKQARMLCIVDSFDAMTTERPYQPTKTFVEAIAELKRCAGTQFDPDLAAAFIEMLCEKYAFKLEAAAASDQGG